MHAVRPELPRERLVRSSSRWHRIFCGANYAFAEGFLWRPSPVNPIEWFRELRISTAWRHHQARVNRSIVI